MTISAPDSENYFMRRQIAGADFAGPDRPDVKVRQQIFRLINQGGVWRIAIP